MVDGERYLDEVGRGPGLGHYENDAILDELRQHIRATAEDFEVHGIDREHAVVAALGRLGPAGVLARELMRARRTPQRRVTGWLERVRIVGSTLAMMAAV